MADQTFSEGQTKLGIGEKDIVPTEREIAVFKKLIGDPLFNVSDTKFPSWMVDTVARYGLPVPISNIIGFSQFTALGNMVGTATESTTSTTYADLATVGPELVHLSDGHYAFLYGGSMFVSVAGTTAFMSLKVNGTEGADDISAATQSTVITAGVFGCLQQLDAGDNTVVCRYRSDTGNSVSFLRRWLIGFKYANL